MSKLVERIALEQFQYVEASADTVDELIALADEVREKYADRLHIKVKKTVNMTTTPNSEPSQKSSGRSTSGSQGGNNAGSALNF